MTNPVIGKRFYVEIRPYTEDEADAGFRRLGPLTERDAERIERGANINLNHANYYTMIVSAETTPAPPVQP